jgi:hypothetical protein
MTRNTQKLLVALVFLFLVGLAPISCSRNGTRQASEKQATSSSASTTEPNQPAQVAAAQPASPSPVENQKPLPHTASPLPLVGLLGLGALLAGNLLRVFFWRRGA